MQTETFLATKSSSNDISVRLEDLNPGTTYYVRLYAKVNNGYIYSETVKFSTKEKRMKYLRLCRPVMKLYSVRVRLWGSAFSGKRL